MNTIDINSIHQLIVNDHNTEKILDNDEWKLLCDEVQGNISEDVMIDLQKLGEDEKKEKYKFYLIASLPILDEFNNCRKNIEKISFFRKKTDSTIHQNSCQDLVQNYTSIVHNFFPNKYNQHWLTNENQTVKKKTVKKLSKIICKFCQKSEDSFQISENHIVCQECGNVIDMRNDNLISYKDIERVNIGSKYSYDRKTHFRECIKRYQGKQNTNIPDHVFTDIIKQLQNYKLIPLSYTPEEEVRVFQDIRREHILMILKDLGYSKYYEDITYIYHKTTKKKIPDISEYEALLLQDFDKLLEVYDSSYKDDRKNFINNQYVLYQLLRRHNYSCEKENFSFLKTNDRKSYHDHICGILFSKLNWNFRPLF